MKNSKHIFSRFFNSVSSSYGLSELAQYTAVFYFNMRTAHFMTIGDTFLELHEYAQELYEQGEEYYDDLVETALSFNEHPVAMYVTPGDWNPEAMDYDRTASNTISLILRSVQRLYDCLESITREVYPSFVYSKIDSMLEWLDKQNYKLTQMSKEIM